MRKFKIIILALLLIGSLMIGFSFAFGLKSAHINEFFSDSYKYKKQDTLVFTNNIETILIDTETKSVKLESHDEDFLSIDYYLKEKEKWTFDNVITNNHLKINQKQKSFWNFNFGFSSKKYDTIVIKVPKDKEISLTIKANLSDVNLKNITLKNLIIDIDVGSININNFTTAENVEINNNTGDIKINDLKTDLLEIASDTGNISLNMIFANSVIIDLGTGNINFKDVYAERSILSTDTGRITVSGNYGNFSLDLKTSAGNVYVDNDKKGKSHKVAISDKNIKATTSTGSIKVYTK